MSVVAPKGFRAAGVAGGQLADGALPGAARVRELLPDRVPREITDRVKKQQPEFVIKEWE